LSAVEPAARYENRWSAPAVEGLSELRALAYRSNLLGADRRIANWGGGNTSSKLEETDHTGRSMRVLRVKGSGTDLATIEPVGFSGLRLDELLVLGGRDAMADADMVHHLLRSGVDPGQPRPSIETLLHAFVPASHVDHTHPDAVIALTCAPGGRRLAEEAFGDEAEWVDWVRPGFALSKLIAERVRGRPSVRFVMLEKHGLVTWGDSGEESYRRTLEAVERSHAALAEHGSRRPFGASCARALDLNGRRELLVQAMPVLRGALSRERHHVLQLDTSDEVLEFLAGEELEHFIGGVQLKDVVALTRERAAQDRHCLDEELASPVQIECPRARRPERPPRSVFGQRGVRALDCLERAPVGLLAAVPPGDEPVLLEHDEAHTRPTADALGDQLRQRESWPHPVDPLGLVAERLLGEPTPAGCACQRDHGVGVCVVDV